MARSLTVGRHGGARHGGARLGEARPGTAWHGAAAGPGHLRVIRLQDLGLVGITIALQDDGTTRLVPYVGKGMLVSDPDPLQRLAKSVAAWWSISEP